MEKSKPITHLCEAISIPTISNRDDSLVDWSQFARFREYLEATYPRVFETLLPELVGKSSLLFRWKGRGDGIPFAILGHMDVVPVSEETLVEWEHPPFEGHFDGEAIWGRGANDMKCHIIALMEAVEQLIIDGYTPGRDVYICFGHNEEVLASDNSGAKAMAALLKERGVRLEFVYDEGGAVIADPPMGLTCPAAMMGLAEKGICDIKVSVACDGGHAAEPPKHTAIGDLGQLIQALDGNQMKSRMTDTVRGTLMEMGRHVKGVTGFMLRNLWITKPAVKAVLLNNNLTAAMLRTTMAPTMLFGGTARNVLPQKASVLYNCRLLPGDTTDDVIAHIMAQAEKLGIADRVETETVVRSDPPMETRRDTPTFDIIKELMTELDPKIITMPYLVTGGTDSREYQGVTDQIFRLYPFILTNAELAGMHGINERISAKGFLFGIEYFKRFIMAQAERSVH